MGCTPPRFPSVPALALLAGLGCAAPPAAAPATSPEIREADLRADLERLAGDAAAGRATGSREALQVARAMAARLQAAGLQPAGDGGSSGLDAFLQVIDTRGFEFRAPPELVRVEAGGARTPAAFGADFEYAGGPPRDGAFELVVLRADAPPQPPRADGALLLLGSRRETSGWLERSGAPGGAGWGVLLVSGRDRPGPTPLGATRGLWTQAAGAPQPPLRLLVHGALRDALASGAVASLELALHAGEPVPAANVAALLPGAGRPGRPELADELLVVTAHYDHLGTLAAPQAPPAEAHGDPGAAPAGAPDLVFNGADDDASGCAVLLELAEALAARAAAGRPPARDVLFLLVTGEERGLLGTEFWLDHAPVPLERIAFNLNLEMLGRPDPAAGGAGRIWLTGFERSNLGPAWAAAGLDLVADPHPQERFFERSDNMAFVVRGVVGQTLSSYGLHPQYHTVDDELELLDLAHLATAARTALRALETLADGELDPAWVPAGRQGV